jgi:dienelactone hydrolase
VITSYRARRAFEGGTGGELPSALIAEHGFFVLTYDFVDPPELVGRTIDFESFVKNAYGSNLAFLRPTVAAIEGALQSLTLRGLIDPSRIAITGFSDGVAVGSLLMLKRPFACAIFSSLDYSPDRVKLELGADRYRDARSAAGFGRPPNDVASLQLSLGANAEKVEMPILVNASDSEYIRTALEVTALRDAGRTIDLWVYPGEAHVKWLPSHRLAVIERNLQWLSLWLAPAKSSEGEQDRFKRWQSIQASGPESGRR